MENNARLTESGKPLPGSARNIKKSTRKGMGYYVSEVE